MVVNQVARVGRSTAALVWAAIVIVLADAIAYLLLVRGQGGEPPDLAATVRFIAGYMVLMALLLWLSVLNQPLLVKLQPALRAYAAAGLLVLGVVGLWSVGLPLLVAGVLATIAAIRALEGPDRSRRVLSEIAAAVIAVTVLVGGYEVTQRVIVCPPSGNMSGTGSGLITGAYSYECSNGTLTMHSG
jgi:hypothetical protein